MTQAGDRFVRADDLVALLRDWGYLTPAAVVDPGTVHTFLRSFDMGDLSDEESAVVWALDEFERDLSSGFTRARSMRRLLKLAGAQLAEFNAKHPRDPAGKFRTVAARVMGSLVAWQAAGRKGDPFHGFSREQLRKVARARGVSVRRGADRAEISKALLDRFEGTARPLTDAEFDERAKMVERVIGDAAKVHATDLTHADADGRWSPERDRIHREIAADLYARAGDVPTDGRAVIAGGLGGAGKTTVLTEYAGIDLSQFLTINPDDIKEELARRGLIPQVPGHPDLSPMERAALVHEESSRIAALIASMAYGDRRNVIWDITMSGRGGVTKRLQAMRDAGYVDIRGIFVDIPVETSVERAMLRYRHGVEGYRQGRGSGGRFVPPSVIRAQRSSAGRTINRETFDGLRGEFTSWAVYDNSVTGRAPQLVDASERHAG